VSYFLALRTCRAFVGRLAADAMVVPPIPEDLVRVQTIQLRVRSYKPVLQSHALKSPECSRPACDIPGA
jgi:hypothetical protein